MKGLPPGVWPLCCGLQATDGGQKSTNRKADAKEAREGPQGGPVPRQQRVRDQPPVPCLRRPAFELWVELALETGRDLADGSRTRLPCGADARGAPRLAL